MENLSNFKQFLLTKERRSFVTVKNYVSDIRKFISWYQSTYKIEFNPSSITLVIIDNFVADYKKNGSSIRSIERYISSLRKFFAYLEKENLIPEIPFEKENLVQSNQVDLWRLRDFKDFLYVAGASALTIKNYLADIRAYKTWVETSISSQSDYIIDKKSISDFIKPELISDYKQRLVAILQLSPKTVNRKLSSIRKYNDYANKNGLIISPNIPSEEAISPTLSLTDIVHSENQEKTYSKIPPIRIFQRSVFLFDHLINNLSNLIVSKIRQGRIDKDAVTFERKIKGQHVGNIEKEFYAPHLISISSLPVHKQLIHHLKYTRPGWYKNYHSYAFVHYLHFAVLMIFAAVIGYAIFHDLFELPAQKSPLFASELIDKRIIPFEGRLTDTVGNPITESSDLHFKLYTDPIASGSALIWEETHKHIKPDTNGVFNTLLGSIQILPNSFFTDSSLYLGITVDNSAELSPRQRITSTGYSGDSQLLQGMRPITDPDAGLFNSILALDSSGNLSIGGSLSPLFQATGGQFRLSGQGVLLTTLPGSNANIEVFPDGEGKIDLQKAIINSSQDGRFTGAVEIQDSVVITASDSAYPALRIESPNGGDLISASSEAGMQFVIDGYGYVGINKPRPSYHLDIAGDIRVSGITNLNDVSYIWPSKDGAPGSVLSTDGAGGLFWNADSSNNYFSLDKGAVYSSNPTVDLLLGGSSTGSAKFAVINLLSGVPTATLSAGPQGSFSIDANGVLGTTHKQAITLGNLTTGEVRVMPSGNASATFFSNGNVSIGTSNQEFRLLASDSQSATVTAMLLNSDVGPNADVLALKLGGVSLGPNNRFITFLNGEGSVAGSIQANGSGVTYATTGIDFAEYYRKEDPKDQLLPGDPVCIGIKGGVERCRSSGKIIGIVSDRPGFVGGSDHQNDTEYVLVGIVGQLPVRISDTSSELKASDPVRIMFDGFAGKAISASAIIGYALEPSSGKQQILVSLNPTWYDPEASLSSTGSLVFEPEKGFYTSNYTTASASFELKETFSDIVEKSIVELEAKSIVAATAAIEQIQSKSILVSKITADAIEVTSESIFVNGKELSEYIIDTIKEDIRIGKIESPLASISEIRTNVISPLSENSPKVIFGDEKITLTNSSGSALFTVDNYGNATVSSSLTAININSENLSTNDATVSGKLFANSIVAKSIDGLEEKIATYAASFFDQSKQNVTPFNLPSDFMDISTLSAQFALITEGIVSLGTSTFRELSVDEVVKVGDNFEIAANSLNVIGDDLYIQPLRQGGVNFLSGLIRFEPNGDIHIIGDAYFASDVTIKGILSASILSPLPGSDFAVKLTNPLEKESRPSEFILQNSSGSAILRVTQDGNVQASGSGSFSKLKLNIISQAYAISDTQAVASGSAGAAIIKANRNEVTIQNPEVTSTSLIYITPSGNTEGAVLYLMRQVPGISFTVGVNNRKPFDIPFNWIIVN